MSNFNKSAYRKELRSLIKSLEFAASRAFYEDPLIHGTPLEVYRRCGKKTCACRHDDNARHGPYPVILIQKEGRRKQVSIRVDEKEKYWRLARRYQYQMETRKQMRKTMERIIQLFDEAISMRTISFPKPKNEK